MLTIAPESHAVDRKSYDFCVIELTAVCHAERRTSRTTNTILFNETAAGPTTRPGSHNTSCRPPSPPPVRLPDADLLQAGVGDGLAPFACTGEVILSRSICANGA